MSPPEGLDITEQEVWLLSRVQEIAAENKVRLSPKKKTFFSMKKGQDIKKISRKTALEDILKSIQIKPAQLEKMLSEYHIKFGESLKIREPAFQHSILLSDTGKPYFFQHVEKGDKVKREGMLGTFKLAVDPETRKIIGVKIQKYRKGYGREDELRNEVEMMDQAGVIYDSQTRDIDSRISKHYIIQEYFEGKELKDVASEYPSSSQQFEELFLSMLANLQILQEKKIIHRDLKVQNFIKLDGQDQVVAFDYGWAMRAGNSETGRSVANKPLPHNAELFVSDEARGFKSSLTSYIDMDFQDKKHDVQIFSYQSDIFSVAKIIREILSNGKSLELPIELLTILEKMEKRIIDGETYKNTQEIVGDLPPKYKEIFSKKLDSLRQIVSPDSSSTLTLQGPPIGTVSQTDVPSPQPVLNSFALGQGGRSSQEPSDEDNNNKKISPGAR